MEYKKKKKGLYSRKGHPGHRSEHTVEVTRDSKTGRYAKRGGLTPPSHKICYQCDLEQPIDKFYRYEKMADGHLNICNTCQKARVKESRRRSKELLEREVWGDEGWDEEWTPEPPKEVWVPLTALTKKQDDQEDQ